MGTGARIAGVKPTPFFVREGGELRQRVDVVFEVHGVPGRGAVRVSVPGVDERVALTLPGEGMTEQALYVPDVREACRVTLALEVDGEVADTRVLDWQPQRHWEVYLVQYSHHDMGYTDLPSNVQEEYDGFIDQALDFCEETEAWAEVEARFRYQLEQAWSLVHYLEHRPPEAIERLKRFVKAGQIEVTALFGNQTLELCSHEELVRLLYPALRLRREWGIEVESAKHNDIPGFAWGLASVLAGADVRVFSPGIPVWYFNGVHPLWDTAEALPLDIPAACWWEGPDGQRVLLWSDLHGMEWQPYGYEQALEELPGMLERLEPGRYPYDVVCYTLRGGHRDNAPPTLRYATMVREWNRRWAYPRLINATNGEFTRLFAQRWGGTLKTLRGDVPGTDYSAAATCTPAETAVDRAAHSVLSAAERLATVASMVSDYEAPVAQLERAYREAFYYDLHCWGHADVGGPAQDGHWAEKGVRAYRAAALSHDVLVKATQRMADGIGYADDGWYLTVFNPLAQPCTQVVRAPLRAWSPCGTPMHLEEADEAHRWPRLVAGGAIGRGIANPPAELMEGPFELIDVASGKRVAHQLTTIADPQAPQPWAPERVALGRVDGRVAREVALVAEALPPMGYRTFKVAPGGGRADGGRARMGSPAVLENELYRLELDRQTGTVRHLVDKGLQRDFVDPEAPHGLGQVVIRTSDTAQEMPVRFEQAEVVEDGALFTAVRLKGGGDCCPRVTADVTLYHTTKRIELALRVLRDSTPQREVYVAFPFAIPNPTFHFDASGAVIEPLRDQWPGSATDYYAVQAWVDVSSPEWGVTWTPLDTPMAELGGLWPGYVSGAHHGVTGPGYGHAFLKPGELKRGHIYALAAYHNFRTNFINVHPGEFVARYALTTHAGGWREAQAWAFGWETISPPPTVWMRGPQEGQLPSAASFCEVDAPNVMVMTLKPADDGNGVVVRLWETAGEATRARVTVPYLVLGGAWETNLVEEDREALGCTEHSFEVGLRPFGMATVRLVGRGLR